MADVGTLAVPELPQILRHPPLQAFMEEPVELAILVDLEKLRDHGLRSVFLEGSLQRIEVHLVQLEEPLQCGMGQEDPEEGVVPVGGFLPDPIEFDPPKRLGDVNPRCEACDITPIAVKADPLRDMPELVQLLSL